MLSFDAGVSHSREPRVDEINRGRDKEESAPGERERGRKVGTCEDGSGNVKVRRYNGRRKRGTNTYASSMRDGEKVALGLGLS